MRFKGTIQATIERAYDNRDDENRKETSPLARLLLTDCRGDVDVESVAVFSGRSDVVAQLVDGVGRMFVLPVVEGAPYGPPGQPKKPQFSLGRGNVTEIDQNSGKSLPTEAAGASIGGQQADTPHEPLKVGDGPQNAVTGRVGTGRGLTSGQEASICGVHKSTLESGGSRDDCKKNARNLIESWVECDQYIRQLRDGS